MKSAQIIAVFVTLFFSLNSGAGRLPVQLRNKTINGQVLTEAAWNKLSYKDQMGLMMANANASKYGQTQSPNISFKESAPQQASGEASAFQQQQQKDFAASPAGQQQREQQQAKEKHEQEVAAAQQNDQIQYASNKAEMMKDPRCFYGGVPADTDTKKGRTNKCERIDSFDKLQKKLGNINNLTGDCGQGMVMCNPLVFGVDKGKSEGEFKVVCVKASNNATKSCEKVSKGTRQENLKKLLADEKNKRLLAKFRNTLKRTCGGYTESAEAAKTTDKAALQENCETLDGRLKEIARQNKIDWDQANMPAASTAQNSGAGQR